MLDNTSPDFTTDSFNFSQSERSRFRSFALRHASSRLFSTSRLSISFATRGEREPLGTTALKRSPIISGISKVIFIHTALPHTHHLSTQEKRLFVMLHRVAVSITDCHELSSTDRRGLGKNRN